MKAYAILDSKTILYWNPNARFNRWSPNPKLYWNKGHAKVAMNLHGMKPHIEIIEFDLIRV